MNGVASGLTHQVLFPQLWLHSFVGIVEINRTSGPSSITYALDQSFHRSTQFRILGDEALNFFHRVNYRSVMLPAELSCNFRIASLRKALAKIHCYLSRNKVMASV